MGEVDTTRTDHCCDKGELTAITVFDDFVVVAVVDPAVDSSQGARRKQ